MVNRTMRTAQGLIISKGFGLGVVKKRVTGREKQIINRKMRTAPGLIINGGFRSTAAKTRAIALLVYTS